MGYSEFFRVANIANNEKRLIEFAKYYASQKLEGLHYSNFFPSTNVLSVCRPDHSTHHEATSFLIDCKQGHYSPNTIRNYGNHLKRFLDFLKLWNMDVLDGDIFIILTGFVDYMRLIETKGSANFPLPNRAIEWAAITYVPLHQEALSLGKITSFNMDEYGNRKVKDWGQIRVDLMSKILSVVVRYLIFLRNRTNKYSYLDLLTLPVKDAYKGSFLSGTLGKVKVEMFDIKSIFNKVGLKVKVSKKKYSPLKSRIPTVSEMNYFFNSLPTNKRQDKFLFHCLKCFGIRESEASNLMIDTSTIPNNFIYLNNAEAIDLLKMNLRGDIEFQPDINKWICKVINRNSEAKSYQERNKSIEDRYIPLFFAQDEFSTLFLDALKERYLIMKRRQRIHQYIFVSRAPKRMGQKITGRTVYDKLKNTLENCIDLKSKLQEITPHTFRHYYASYSLRILKLNIDDVSRYLGHSDIEITKGTYSHLLHDNNEETEEKVLDMSDTFRASSIGGKI